MKASSDQRVLGTVLLVPDLRRSANEGFGSSRVSSSLGEGGETLKDIRRFRMVQAEDSLLGLQDLKKQGFGSFVFVSFAIQVASFSVQTCQVRLAK